MPPGPLCREGRDEFLSWLVSGLGLAARSAESQ